MENRPTSPRSLESRAQEHDTRLEWEQANSGHQNVANPKDFDNPQAYVEAVNALEAERGIRGHDGTDDFLDSRPQSEEERQAAITKVDGLLESNPTLVNVVNTQESFYDLNRDATIAKPSRIAALKAERAEKMLRNYLETEEGASLNGVEKAELLSRFRDILESQRLVFAKGNKPAVTTPNVAVPTVDTLNTPSPEVAASQEQKPKYSVGQLVSFEINDQSHTKGEGTINGVQVSEISTAYRIETSDHVIYPTVYEEEILGLGATPAITPEQQSANDDLDAIAQAIGVSVERHTADVQAVAQVDQLDPALAVQDVVVDAPELPLPVESVATDSSDTPEVAPAPEKQGMFARLKRRLGGKATLAAGVEPEVDATHNSRENKKNAAVIAGAAVAGIGIFALSFFGLNKLADSDEPQKEPTSSSATQTPGATESAEPSTEATEATAEATDSASPSAKESEKATDSNTSKSGTARVEFEAPVIPDEFKEGGVNIFGGTAEEIEKLAEENNLKTS